MNSKITEVITLARFTNGEVKQIAAPVNVGAANIISQALRGLVWENGFKTIPETEKKIQATNPEDVIRTVAGYFSFDTVQIRLKTRKREIVQARQLCAYFLRIKTTLSFKEIGSLFGGQDHTSQIHSVEKINDLIYSNEGIREYIRDLTNLLALYPNVNSAPVNSKRYSKHYKLITNQTKPALPGAFSEKMGVR